MSNLSLKTLAMLARVLGDSYIDPLAPRTRGTHRVRVVRTSTSALAQGGGDGRTEGDVLTSALTDAQCGTYLRLQGVVFSDNMGVEG